MVIMAEDLTTGEIFNVNEKSALADIQSALKISIPEACELLNLTTPENELKLPSKNVMFWVER